MNKYDAWIREFSSGMNNSSDWPLKLAVGVGTFVVFNGFAAFYIRNYGKQNNNSNLISNDSEECSVCYEKIQSKKLIKVTKNCLHPSKTCTKCLHSYIDINLRSKRYQKIKCLHSNCSEYLKKADIQRICGTIMYNLYIHLKSISKLRNHPNFRPCSQADCLYGEIIELPSENLKNHANNYWECKKCNSTNCFEHRCLVHSCNLHSNEIVSEISDVKQCPNCNMGIAKSGGCAHMKCQWCSTEFCWCCNQIYKNSFCFHSCDCIYFWGGIHPFRDIDEVYFDNDFDIDDDTYWWFENHDESSVLGEDIEESKNEDPESSSEIEISDKSSSWIESFLSTSNESYDCDSNDSAAAAMEIVWNIINTISTDDSDDDLESYW